MARPLFDVVADFTTGPPTVPGVHSVSLNTVAGTRTQGWSIRRGRQYELGNAEAGSFALTMFDRAETLNPTNTSSPWNTGGNSLLPYRCIQQVAFWNQATLSTAGNLLNSTNTTPSFGVAYDPSFETTVGWMNAEGSSATLVQSTAQAFTGTHSLALTLTSSGDVGYAPLWTVPGNTYTMSVYVFVPTGKTVSLWFGRFDTGATYGTATSTVTGAWQRLTVTATVPVAASYFQVRGATGTYSYTVYVDACQLELAATASTFTTSGPTRYARYTGYIERYPQTWTDAGFRGVRPLEAVDALSVLSRTVINQSYQSTILADSPVVYVPYSDDSIPQLVQLPQGGAPFLGYQSLGTQGAVNFKGDTFPDGSPAVTVVQQNSNPVTSGNSIYITNLGTRNGAVWMNPQAFTIECWIRWTSGTASLGAGAVQPGENPNTEALGPQWYVGWSTITGRMVLQFSDPNGGVAPQFPIGSGAGGWTGYPDGNWHHLFLRFPGSNTFNSIVDGVVGGTPGVGFTPSLAIGLNDLFVNSSTYFGDPATDIAVANLAIYATALTSTRAQAHYQRGIGYLNEASGARVARLLAAYWSATNYTAASGMAKLAPDFDYDPVGSPQSARTMLDVLQEISNTENGFIWANVAGIVVWEDRSTRVAQQTATGVIGNGPGQIHPETIEYDYDPTYVYSQVNLTRPANTNYPPQTNSTSIANYGQRILSATLQVNSDYDLQQAANFYLARYATPGGAPGSGTGPRIRKLVLNPAADPSQWGFVLGLDLSQRVTVSFATSAGVTMTYDYYVENISETHNPADGTHTVELQLSPVFVPTAGVLGDATYGVLGSTTYVVY